MRKMSILVLLACFIGTAFGAWGVNTVVRPNGGNGWATGLVKPIRWSHTKKDTVKIELWKGSTKYMTIADSVQRNIAVSPAYSKYNWSIPTSLPVGSDYRVKIMNYQNSNKGRDSSDADFSIILNPNVVLTAPNGGEVFEKGEVTNITWTTNLTDSVRIILLRGSSEVRSIDTVLASTLSYAWTVPNVTSANNYKIRIEHFETDFATICDESYDFFEIGAPTAEYTITKPNTSGLIWLKGKSGIALYKNINWTHKTSTELVDLDFITGTTASPTVTSIDTDVDYTLDNYAWDISGLTTNTTYSVRISGATTTTDTDTSDYRVTVYDSLYLDSTTSLYSTRWTRYIGSNNSSERIVTDSSYTISWINSATNIPTAKKIKINLYQGGDFHSEIAEVSVNTLTNCDYIWHIPADLPTGTNYSIEIVSVDYPTVFRDISKPFTVRKRTAQITSPKEGDLLLTGVPIIVKLFTARTTSAAARDFIHLSLIGSGTTFPTADSVANATPGNLNFVWTPSTTLPAGSDYQLIASAHINNALVALDTSEVFSIAASKTISNIVPSNVTWNRGTQHNITWEQNFINETVVIALFKNDVQIGAPLATEKITTGTTGSYTWDIPGSLDEAFTYKIKIWNQSYPSIRDSSAVNFKITEGSIRVTSPDVSGVSWVRGTSQDITWVSTDIPENVKIEAFPDGISTDSVFVIAASAPSNNNGANGTIPNSYQGKYTWVIPATMIARNYKIKVTALATGSPTDQSNSVFAITAPPAIVILTPDVDMTLLKGSEYNITWADNITQNVKIDLLKEVLPATTPKKWKHNSWIKTTTPSTGGSYTWKIPTTLTSSGSTSDYKIRIQSVNSDSLIVRDSSSAAFKIVTNPIIVVSPNVSGNGPWTLDSTVTARWTMSASLAGVATTGGTLVFTLIKASNSAETALTSTTPSTMAALTPTGARSATFRLPTTLAVGEDYKLKISSTTGTAYDLSDSAFTIRYAFKRTDIEDQFVNEFKLEQNYPNPFNNTTEITYYVPTGYNDNVRVSIYNIKGELIRNLVNRTHTGGKHFVNFNADSFVSGVYYYAIEGKNFKDIKRMLFLK